MKGSIIDALAFESMTETRIGVVCDGLTMDQIEEAMIRYRLAKHGGHRGMAAASLGMSERTFLRRIVALGLKRKPR